MLRCDYHMVTGWWCSRGLDHTGPCALRPCWWNLPARWRYRTFRRDR